MTGTGRARGRRRRDGIGGTVRRRPPLGVGLLLAGAATVVGAVFSATAQVPPTPAEVATYAGLHAAAARGDTAEITRLAAAGADPDARDGRGRTRLLRGR